MEDIRPEIFQTSNITAREIACPIQVQLTPLPKLTWVSRAQLLAILIFELSGVDMEPLRTILSFVGRPLNPLVSLVDSFQ